jgi:hypothetical protein
MRDKIGYYALVTFIVLLCISSAIFIGYHTFQGLKVGWRLIPLMSEIAEGQRGWALIYVIGFSGMVAYLISQSIGTAWASIRKREDAAGMVAEAIPKIIIAGLGMPLWAILIAAGGLLWPVLGLGLFVSRWRKERVSDYEEQESYEDLVDDIREERQRSG